MAKVQHYRGLGTDLERLYDSIKAEMENEKNLQVASEYKGEMNGKPLRSIVALNKSLKVFAGSLREIHISILGTPDDYAVEVASGSWFGSILFPGAVGLIVGGPIGGVNQITLVALLPKQSLLLTESVAIVKLPS